MKIASFNINNINGRLTNLLNWLREAEPDIVCLQGLKVADTEFPAEAIRQVGHHAVCRGERRWNGVAILARWAPVVTRMDLPGDTPDGQCRYLEAAVNGVLVASIYAPNGNPQPGPKFDYKLAWLKRLNAHAAELYATGAPVVLAGDYNVVPTDLRSRAPHCVPSGNQSRGHRVPGRGNPAGGLSCGMPRREALERRGDFLARWAPIVTCMDLPGDTPDGQCRYLEAAVNGRARRLDLRSQRKPPSPGPNSITSSPG